MPPWLQAPVMKRFKWIQPKSQERPKRPQTKKELTDDDIAMFNGNVDQLMGTIQRKTGAARESIENFLGQITSGGAAAISGVGDSARAGAHQAMESIQASSDAAAAAVRDGYADLEAIVRKRPAESLLACFGVGLVTGVVVSLLLQRK